MVMIKNGVTNRGMNGNDWHGLSTYSKLKYADIYTNLGSCEETKK